jgi:hypothetical protein
MLKLSFRYKMLKMKLFILFTITGIWFILLPGCRNDQKDIPNCPEITCWEKLIADHIVRYPEGQLRDVYKLIYQSTLGPGHAISDTAMVRQWMEKDLSNLDTLRMEPLADTLGSCGRYARIHINRYLKEGGHPDELIQYFIATANQVPPDSNSFFCALSALKKMATDGEMAWTEPEVDEFITTQAHAQYPALHHSPEYQEKYHPAYRVVAREFVPVLMNQKNKGLIRNT